MTRLTDKHLQQAGARLVRTGNYADDKIVAWGVSQNLTPEQIKQLIIGAQAERTKAKRAP